MKRSKLSRSHGRTPVPELVKRGAPRGARRLALVALGLMGATANAGSCQLGSDGAPPPQGSGGEPSVSVSINGIPDAMASLLVVPPSGFVVTLALTPSGAPIDPDSIGIGLERWGGSIQMLAVSPSPDGSSARLVVPGPLATGTWTAIGVAVDSDGNVGNDELDFAVRDYPNGTPPIGSGQQIWLDFEADRDATPGPDFAVDLRSFGLGSASAPVVSALAEDEIVQRILDRVAEIYHLQDPTGLGGPDPIDVTFSADPPAGGDVTQICVGGEDPSGGVTIGTILIDPNNADRNSVECATIPPTGIFPRELLVLKNEPAFQDTFDALRSTTGGTPVGADPWDAVILDPGFDPASASGEAAARWERVDAAMQVFADALGTIVAHETAHALGLVPAGAPGAGLYGGSVGARLQHNVEPGGGDPAENFVMNAGNTYTLARLSGLEGEPLAFFRPLNHAYLRDRVVLAPKVTALLPPPKVTAVNPSLIANDLTAVTVTGRDFAATPALRCVNYGYVYNMIGETFVSESEVTGQVFRPQVVPGVYDLELENPDGQKSVLADAITVQ